MISMIEDNKGRLVGATYSKNELFLKYDKNEGNRGENA